MDKKIAGFAGAISSLASMHAAEASPVQNVTEIVNPQSYAELLQPIPNAAALLKAIDAEAAARTKAEGKRNPSVRLAQIGATIVTRITITITIITAIITAALITTTTTTTITNTVITRTTPIHITTLIDGRTKNVAREARASCQTQG